MKVVGRKSFYLLLVVLLPLATYAELTDYVVFKHPINRDEIWMTNLKNTQNARLLFKCNDTLKNLSVQRNSRYIATVIANNNQILPGTIEDIYRVNTLRSHAVQIQTIIEDIVDIDISYIGDIILVTAPHAAHNQKPGIYLIRSDEITKQTPAIILLKEINSGPQVAWSPNGKQIAYGSNKGLFLFDVGTGSEMRIRNKGSYPVFSPDGIKLAYALVDPKTGARQIDIISLDTIQPLRIIKDLVVHSSFHGLRWSPDGEFLIYTAFGSDLFHPKTLYHNIAIPVNGGPHLRILDIENRGVEMFDWFNSAYPVEPVNRLTTLWGKIKQ